MFHSNNNVGCSVGIFVKRPVQGEKTKDIIPGPPAQVDYVENFNAIDRNNRDSLDYSTTKWMIRYYI